MITSATAADNDQLVAAIEIAARFARGSHLQSRLLLASSALVNARRTADTLAVELAQCRAGLVAGHAESLRLADELERVKAALRGWVEAHGRLERRLADAADRVAEPLHALRG